MIKKYRGPRRVDNEVNESHVKATNNITFKRPLVEDDKNKSNKRLMVDDKNFKQIKQNEQLFVENNNITPKKLKVYGRGKTKKQSPVKDLKVEPKKSSPVENKITKPKDQPLAKENNMISIEQVLDENNYVKLNEWQKSEDIQTKPKELSPNVHLAIPPKKGKKDAFYSKLDRNENKFQVLEVSNVDCPKNAFKVPPLKIIIHNADSAMKTDDKNNKQLLCHSTLPFVKPNEESLSTSVQSVLPISPQKITIDTITAEEKISPTARKLRSSNKSDNNKSSELYLNTSTNESVEQLVQTTSTSTMIIDARNNKESVCCMDSSSINETSESNLAADLSRLNVSESDTNPMSFSDSVSAAKAYLAHPTIVPVKNSYEMYLDLRKEIGNIHKNLFPVRPKPPSGFKDYLMNKRTYHLHGNSNSRVTYAPILPAADLDERLKTLFNEQEKERHKLRLHHMVQKEKLVLCIEQEIIRIHGQTARELSNQTSPFSACTFLKDEEVYSMPNKDQATNKKSHYDGRVFLSWLQEVDDKWETIKESMIIRHHNEAESLHAVQKMDWGWKLKELQLCCCSSEPQISEDHVPIVQVADDFNLFST